jgi:hypothetical protein
MSKYHNRITWIDGIRFDSQMESDRYLELKLMEKSGDIRELEVHPVFILQPAFGHNGKIVTVIKYVADFQYKETRTGVRVVEDVKGFETRDFKLKQKLFWFKYPNLELRLITK